VCLCGASAAGCVGDCGGTGQCVPAPVATPPFSHNPLLCVCAQLETAMPRPTATPTGIEGVEARLTQGSWTKTLPELDPTSFPPPTSYVYRFHTDQTYAERVCTDVITPDTTGAWSLVMDAHSGSVHLLLTPDEMRDQGPTCYWLACDSIITFDDEHGGLLVSGPEYAGQDLWRTTRRHQTASDRLQQGRWDTASAHQLPPITRTSVLAVLDLHPRCWLRVRRTPVLRHDSFEIAVADFLEECAAGAD